MSLIFSANQLEREFQPRRLGNWEVVTPRRLPRRLRAGRGATRVIADDRGHLLPGIQRSCRPPWGSRVTAWDFPRVPRRHRATDITEPQDLRLTSWEKRSSHVPLARPMDDEVSARRKGSAQLRNHCRSSEAAQRNGDKERSTPDRTTSKPLSLLQITGHATPQAERQARENNGGPRTPLNTSSRKNTPPSPQVADPPLANSYCSALVAKRHAQDNLRHRPLPDIVDDATYRALESCKHAHPGLSLDVEPKAAAVGWRGHGVAGPTQCSKLRVYRPRTAGAPMASDAHPTATDRAPTAHDNGSGSPSTCVAKKSRLPRQGMVSEMQLAICWDVKPPLEQGEPRPSPHIDGSNGSAAPAVFTLVHQPSPEPEHPGCDKPGGCAPQPKTAWVDKNVQPSCRVDGNNNRAREINGCADDRKDNGSNTSARGNGRNSCGSSRGRTSSTDGRKRAATARNSASISVDSADSNMSLVKQKHHQSSPNLAGLGEQAGSGQSHNHYVPGEIASAGKKKLLHARPCIACELKSSGVPAGERPRSDYKMAFKAGKPDSSSSGPSSSGSKRPQTSKVRVPKPRAFLKRNYSIDTLAPPFSLWPGNTGQDYPEHWRLASVYQHAYKPMEARKKPLLASVYQ